MLKQNDLAAQLVKKRKTLSPPHHLLLSFMVFGRFNKVSPILDVEYSEMQMSCFLSCLWDVALKLLKPTSSTLSVLSLSLSLSLSVSVHFFILKFDLYRLTMATKLQCQSLLKWFSLHAIIMEKC